MRWIRHVQRIWGRRPRLDAHSVVFHVIDDPILAVGTDSQFQLARPAYDRVGAQLAEAVIPRPRRRRGQFAAGKAGRSRWPTSVPAQHQARARRISPFRQSTDGKPGMPADRCWHGLARVQFDAERRPTRAELSALDDSARPRPGIAKFNAQFAVSGHLPRPIGDQPVQSVWSVVGDERILGAVVVQPGVAQPANPGRHDETTEVEHILALRDQEFMIADLERRSRPPSAGSKVAAQPSAVSFIVPVIAKSVHSSDQPCATSCVTRSRSASALEN